MHEARPGASSMVFFPSGIFQCVVRPSSSAVQVDAEAQAGAAQVDHIALVVREPEAEVSKRDRAPDVDMMWPTPCLHTILAMMS